MFSFVSCTTLLLVAVVQGQVPPEFSGLPLRCSPRLSEAVACMKIQSCSTDCLQGDQDGASVFAHGITDSNDCDAIDSFACPLLTCCDGCDLTPLVDCTIEGTTSITRLSSSLCELGCVGSGNPTSTVFGVSDPNVLQACLLETGALSNCVSSPSATTMCNTGCISPSTNIVSGLGSATSCSSVASLVCNEADTQCCGVCKQEMIDFSLCVAKKLVSSLDECRNNSLCRPREPNNSQTSPPPSSSNRAFDLGWMVALLAYTGMIMMIV